MGGLSSLMTLWAVGVKEDEEKGERLELPLYEEDVIDGFSFCSFNTFSGLEVPIVYSLEKKEVWWSRGRVPASAPPGPGSGSTLT